MALSIVVMLPVWGYLFMRLRSKFVKRCAQPRRPMAIRQRAWQVTRQKPGLPEDNLGGSKGQNSLPVKKEKQSLLDLLVKKQ